MTRTGGDRSVVGAVARAYGAWLHPVSAFRPRSAPELELQFRVGVVGLFCTISGVLALALSVWWIATGANAPGGGVEAQPVTLQAALVLVIISVFVPQAVFRARNAAMTRQVLSNPSFPIRPWRTTTITFDAVLVGALLAGIYYDAALTLAFFGLAFTVRVVFQSRRAAPDDPNARFHNVLLSWTSAATGAAAFLIVKPLSAAVSDQGSIMPLIFAGLIAMYLGLGFNAVERWINSDHTKWAFARDAVDLRRIIVALVSALIAWLVAYVGHGVGTVYRGDPVVSGSLAGLGVFLASWLILWFISIRMWRRDAQRTLDLWSAHQAEIVTRLTDGSLSPELAARAALPITTRIAVSIFGATRAMAILDDGRGHITSNLVAVDAYDNTPPPEPRTLAALPNLRMPLYSVPGHPNTSSVTVAGWLWMGWFMTRSRGLVTAFTELATSALLTPVIAADDDRTTTAFDAMFDGISRWPTLAAFEEAVDRMRQRADQSPHTDSLLVAVYAIDEFGALAGGRFEQAAIAQVMRLCLGHQDFAGHDLFVAYEAPGRIWVALGGGPIIRTGVGLLRDLQQFINDHGAVPSARLDVDIHVSVSFGYAAHQVDEFTCAGLMCAALNRLAADQGTRSPFAIDDLLGIDIRPEDIIGESDVPVTAIDVFEMLNVDHHAPTSHPFSTRFVPILEIDTGRAEALWAQVGWQRSVGSLDLREPANFLSLVNRQPSLAAEATRVILDRLKAVFAEADALDRRELAILVSLPSILLRPDSGELALPNLMSPFLDHRECARTVVLVDTVPAGGGQALRLLSDRGMHIAVTAAAAAGADPTDLYGWRRWAVIFPPQVVQGPGGIDGLTIQQTASAIAGRETRLIAMADAWVEPRELAEHNIHLTMDPNDVHASVRESVHAGHRFET